MSALLDLMREDKYKPPATATGINEQKRMAAKEWMGSRYVFHPSYVFIEKHRIYKGESDEGNNRRLS